jgi:excisionase family DNA binding protein
VLEKTPSDPGLSLLLTVEEAAEMLRIGRTRTYELVMSGRITSVKIGRSRLVVRASLQEFVERLVMEKPSQ